MITRHPVTREDIAYIVAHLRDRDKREIYALRWNDNEDELVNHIHTWAGAMWQTWHMDGEPVAVDGVVPLRPNVVLACACGTDKWRRVLRPMTRHVCEFIIPALQSAGYHRAEAYVMAANADSARWLEMMGAQREAYLYQYGRDREDYILYAWRLNDVHGRRRRSQRSNGRVSVVY